jgi:NAD(P)-dependent dehydrogenase (short-subunit alcohol dehydrogenase family)
MVRCAAKAAPQRIISRREFTRFNAHFAKRLWRGSQRYSEYEASIKEVRMPEKKTAIVTGAAGGIGGGLVQGFLKHGYNVVATSLNVSRSLTAAPGLVLVEGDIGKQETAAKSVAAAIDGFGTIDVLVNNAGIYLTKPFTEFTTEDFNALVSTNLLGFLYITQLAVKQMLKQKSGNVVTISASLVDQPFAGEKASVSMITKGGLNAVTRSLAIEYAKDGIRFNAVAPGVVDSPMHKDDPVDVLKTFQPMGKIVEIADVVDAVLYLAQAAQVTGEVLHVDGGSHAGRW